MRPESPALFPAFRSALTVQVLVLLLVGAAEHTVSELVEATGEHRRTVYREVVRLETAGVVVSRTIAGTKAYTANTSAPFYLPLRDLVTVVAGPAHVLTAVACRPGSEDDSKVDPGQVGELLGEH